MSTKQLHSQDPAFGRFCDSHPGVLSASTYQCWAEALEAGWTHESLVTHAEVYRRLVESQDIEPLTASQWLTGLAATGPERGLPCEMDAFAAAVRAMRAGRGLSQLELASMSGLTAPTLSAIETGNTEHAVRWSTLAGIAGAFECSLADMFEIGYRVLGR